jgi:hypothetical protein
MAVPALPLIIAALGATQAGVGAGMRAQGRRGLAQAEAEYKKNPYLEDVGISDVYNRQLAATNVSPIESAEGRIGQQQIQRNLLTALRGGGRQSGNVEGILRSGQDATAKMIANLSAQKRAERSMLAQAAQMRMGERMKKYKYNVLDPLARKTSMEGQRMAEGGAMISSGLRSAISGLSAMGGSSTT